MSTFSPLYKVVKNTATDPLEDYLTEVVAPIFKKKDILMRFVYRFAGDKFGDAWNIKISTQKTYKQLKNHPTDSWLDLVITFEIKKEEI